MTDNQFIKSSGGIVIRKDRDVWKVALLYKNQSWFFPKGRIEMGENEEQAALREIKEELGIPLKKLKIITKLGYMKYIASQLDDNYILRPKIVSLFLIKTNQLRIRPFKKDGFQKARWFSIKDALRIVPYPEMKSNLLKTINFLEKEYKDIKTIIIAAGGKGERMKLKNFPKLLLPIQGKAFLGHLMDIILSCESNFKQIYIFTHHYTKEIQEFLEYNYGSEKHRIRMVYTGANTTTQQLYSAKNLSDQNFIYMDGNIVCHPLFFKEFIQQHSLSRSLITLAVSPKILAPTHLQIKIESGNKITDSFSGLFTNSTHKQKMFCSMGIFAINNHIFDLLPDLVYFYDLDLVIDFLIKSEADFNIFPYIYKKEWYCLHDRKDYKLMKTQGKQFFSSINKYLK